MMNPITAAALIQARQDDIARRLNDPRRLALEEHRRHRQQARAAAREERRRSRAHDGLWSRFGLHLTSRTA